MSTMVLYGVTALLLIISFVKDRKKTVQALRKAWKALEHILPEFLVVILLVGLLLALLNPQAISAVIGKDSGLWGLLISLIVGSITLIPGFVAFPTAAMLLQGGAGYMQIGAFISSLMMVGVVTIPVERKYFGLRLTVGRNLLAFLFSVIVALVIGMVMGEL
ncbi:MAG: permease [Sphaerochaetaceae bacterium]|nr:permease [Sphaerochaetaceae bacterium]MDX9939553.1 permease [Sphaerochaetaceae bacterium]